MFTGIITAVAAIVEVCAKGDTAGHGKRLTIEAPAGYLDDVGLGDSIALNGACMTVTAMDPSRQRFSIDISAESLAKTACLDRVGRINLEKALRAQDRLGGHIVSGHVDGIGQVQQLARVGESWELVVRAPLELGKFLAYKGSVAINGASLTINRVHDTPEGTDIHINLIPHTIDNTALGSLAQGSKVNLEVDTVARYCERMLSYQNAA